MDKKNINKVKRAYTVDITDCVTAEDVEFKFALAKHNAGIALTDNNLISIINRVCEMLIDEIPCITIIECEREDKVKLPWYKRLWNALKHQFTR